MKHIHTRGSLRITNRRLNVIFFRLSRVNSINVLASGRRIGLAEVCALSRSLFAISGATLVLGTLGGVELDLLPLCNGDGGTAKLVTLAPLACRVVLAEEQDQPGDEQKNGYGQRGEADTPSKCAEIPA